jgi:hypothetical protein
MEREPEIKLPADAVDRLLATANAMLPNTNYDLTEAVKLALAETRKLNEIMAGDGLPIGDGDLVLATREREAGKPGTDWVLRPRS